MFLSLMSLFQKTFLFSTGLWVQSGGSIKGVFSPLLLLWSEFWVRTCWFLYKRSFLYFYMLLDLSLSIVDCEPTLPHLPFEITHQSSSVRFRGSYESVVCPHPPSSFNLCDATSIHTKRFHFASRFQIFSHLGLRDTASLIIFLNTGSYKVL